MATLWISSMMMTVLPTPAPPNSPILPPFTNGATRSITLIPVSNTSVLGSRSTNLGASRWIGQRSAADGIGSPSSTGSPSTFRMRPSEGSPTGTVIASSLSFQRFRPTRDLRDLLCDLRLSRPVVGPLQQLDDVAGVVGRVLHGRALCTEERRRRLYQSPVHLVADVQRQQLLEDRFGGGFENVIGGPATDPRRSDR